MWIRRLHVNFGQTERAVTRGLGWARREIRLAFLTYRTLEGEAGHKTNTYK